MIRMKDESSRCRVIVTCLIAIFLAGFSVSCTQVEVRPPHLLIVSERTPEQVSMLDRSSEAAELRRLVPGDSVVLNSSRVALVRWNMSDLRGMVADGSGRLHIFCASQGESLKILALPPSMPDDDERLAPWLQGGLDLRTIAEGRLEEIDGRMFVVFDISTAEMQRWIDGRVVGVALEAEGEWDLGLVGNFAPLSFAVRPEQNRRR